jgi:hypothetical protein
MDTMRLAWEQSVDEEHGHPVLAYEPDIAAEIDGEERGEDGETLTASDFRKLTQAFGPIFGYLLNRNQREGIAIPITDLAAIGQRVQVMRHMTSPRASDFGNFADMARAWNVSRTVVARHVRDWNAVFGIFSSCQKTRIDYDQEDSPKLRSRKYSEAAKRGHATRRFRRQPPSP